MTDLPVEGKMPWAGAVSAKEIAQALRDIASFLTFAGEKRFKIKAYEHGADVVAGLDDQLGAAIAEGRLIQIEGIGPALSRQIEELWRDGESSLLTRLRGEYPKGVAELMLVKGITPLRARTLYTALGIDSVQALLRACNEGRIRSIKGFGPKTETRLCEEAERWLNRGPEQRRILLSHALSLFEKLRARLEGRAVRKVELAGSARRGEEVVSELEVLIDGEEPFVFEQLVAMPEVIRVDPDACSAQLTDGISLHLHFGPLSQLGTRLLYATGPSAHVRALQERAHDMGRSLTPQGVADQTGVVREQPNEREVYRALGLHLVPAELRDRKDELARAEHDSFQDLLESADIRGAVHCHTTYSDGKNSIEEMAVAAENLGLEYITITDHSQSARYANGLDLEQLKRQWDEIDAVQERVRIRILKGTECDILADGSLDFADDVIERFDVVVASIHQRFKLDRAAMTQRLVRALSLPCFKIWGHALGRILLHRDAIDCDVPAVLDALAASPGAVEINSDPHRLDLAPAWIPLARERKIPFVISVDAHSKRGLGVLPYGVTMARRGGVRASEVLNTLSPAAFAARVRPTGKAMG